MISVAVLGAGRIGQIHARNVAAHPRARLAGIADLDGQAAERLATACAAAAIGTDTAFAADAVMICTPTPTHADLIDVPPPPANRCFAKSRSTSRPPACAPVWRRSSAPASP